jgi:hypothetical protein
MAVELMHGNNKFLYFPALCDKKYHRDLLRQILGIQINTNTNISSILLNHDYIICKRLINQFVDLVNHYQNNNLRFNFFELTGWDKKLNIYVDSQCLSLFPSDIYISLEDYIKNNTNINNIYPENKIVFGYQNEKTLHIVIFFSKNISDIKHIDESFSDIKKKYSVLLALDYSDIAYKKTEELKINKLDIENKITKYNELLMRLESSLQKTPHYRFEYNSLNSSFNNFNNTYTKRDIFEKKIKKIKENIKKLQLEQDTLEKKIHYFRKNDIIF